MRIFCLGLLLGVSLIAKPSHPLDPLESSEIADAVKILKAAGKVGPDTRFPTVSLKEPAKSEVLQFKPGAKIKRRVFAVVFESRKGKTAEAVVDLSAKKLESWKDLPQVQPSVLVKEFDEVPVIVRADTQWQEAMKKRGIKDLKEVMIDSWAYGTPDKQMKEGVRFLRAVSYYQGKATNPYAKPIEGVTVIVNMNERKVERVIDTGVVPIPPETSDFDAKSISSLRKAPLPLRITQPEGNSFEVHGHEVRWQKWRFRYGMDPREGLILYQIGYEDQGKLRSILYRASLSDMVVPYGDKDENWTFRNAFDEGEYGVGRYGGPLEKGTDAPQNATFFDATFADDLGTPYSIPNMTMLYERDGGVLWKHYDMDSKKNESRRSRELVIGYVTTISNYDYGFNWVFHQDGTMEMQVSLTGIMLAKGMPTSGVDEHDHMGNHFGHLVAPFVSAIHHQHFFNFRLDFDIDTPGGNQAVELNTRALAAGEDNPMGNAFVMEESVLKSEKEGKRDMSMAAQRKWKVINPSVRNALGYPAGYLLVPGENSVTYMNEDAPVRKRAGFLDHQVWFTPYRPDEMHAAGEYPNQRPETDGLARWTGADRSLDKEDVVLWYTVGITHAPRPEEWPVMPTHLAGFKLMPIGFFSKNPALDVPKPEESLLGRAKKSGGMARGR